MVRNALEIGGDAGISVLLASVLSPEEWNVYHAASNAAALELVEARPYALIVTGEKASASEDIELLREVRRQHSETRFIILADESTTTDVVRAMGEHAFTYFSRPFSDDDLKRMIRIATDKASWDDGIKIVSATHQRIRLNVRCDFETAERALQFLEEIDGLPGPERRQLTAASRELLYNAIEYGGRFDPTNHVEIDHVRTGDMVTCRISDHGPGFAFDKIPHAAVANPADDPTHHIDVRQEQGMRPGGYGILVARRLVDELVYGREGREVLLVKRIARAKAQGC